MKHLKAVSPSYDSAAWERERLANKKIMERLRTVRQETGVLKVGARMGRGKPHAAIVSHRIIPAARGEENSDCAYAYHLPLKFTQVEYKVSDANLLCVFLD